MFQTGKPGPCALRREGRYALAILVRNRVVEVVMAVLACAAVAGPAPSAVAQCQYEITAIITPDDAEACWPLPASNTFARGMNSKGEIVGYYTPCALGNERAFFWSKETGFSPLPHPVGVSQAYAIDINDHGIIIGRHVISGVGGKGFAYDPKTGVFTYLEPVHPGVVATELTVASSINNSNIITGSRVISEPGEPLIRNAVLWDFNSGEVIDLGVGAGPNSRSEGGNEQNDAVGCSGGFTCFGNNSEATLWIDGMSIGLGFLSDTSSSYAEAINDCIEVVGASRESVFDQFRGFYWHEWLMVELVPPAPLERFRPWSISDYGQIVGTLQPGNVAGLWQQGEFHMVQSLLHAPLPGLVLDSAAVLNKHGQIRGGGTLNGKTVGVLLSPINTPLGDFDFNCKVNIADLLFLLSEWQQPDSNADLNGNGTVGVPDLLILLSNWSP